MGFFKRHKDSNSDKHRENNDLKHCDFDGVTATEVEMQIDSIRPGYKSDDGRIIDLPEGVPFDYANHVCAVILKEIKGERYLPMYIGGHDADAIVIKLQHVVPPRPLTHDFLCAVICLLGASVKNVIIDSLKNDCFYAKTVLDYKGTLIEVDCRPSDAFSVAVSSGAPIFANEEVLREVGVRLDPITGLPIEEV
jgi:bifunctional DNase/RNase